MAEKCMVLCTDYNCEHNSGGGYYGVCNNPNRPGIYCGIDRMYMSSCKQRQPPKTESSKEEQQ